MGLGVHSTLKAWARLTSGITKYKPNGSPWNSDLRSDRNEARQLVDTLQPTWLIGSPPCTTFSIGNRNLNYEQMDKDRACALIAKGRRHLVFVASLYRKQVIQGRHFLHEDPANALSWSEPTIAALPRHPQVHCVVADQCQYGLTTPAAGDPSKQLPTLKPIRFVKSTPQMAAVLSKAAATEFHPQIANMVCLHFPLGHYTFQFVDFQSWCCLAVWTLDPRHSAGQVHPAMVWERLEPMDGTSIQPRAPAQGRRKHI